MTEKRYFKKEWEGEYYIFDSQQITEKEFEEKLDYEGYSAFQDCLTGDEIVKLLNGLTGENTHSKLMISTLTSIVLEHDGVELENENLKKQLIIYKELYPDGGWITKLTANEIKTVMDLEFSSTCPHCGVKLQYSFYGGDGNKYCPKCRKSLTRGVKRK